jgi:hypothetical protein
LNVHGLNVEIPHPLPVDFDPRIDGILLADVLPRHVNIACTIEVATP